MPLSERSRSELYQGLRTVASEEAVGEMLSYFPARDVEEPVTKEFFRAESAAARGVLNSQLTMARSDLTGQMAELRTDLTGEMAQLRTDMTGQMAELRGQVRGIQVALWINAGVLVSFAGLILATLKI